MDNINSGITNNVVVETKGITKIYNGLAVLNDVNMTVCEGDIYGFVGENGSGKTTLIRVITGLITQNSGSFKLFGVNNTDVKQLNAIKKNVGAIVESPSIFAGLSARDNIAYMMQLKNIEYDENKITELLNLVSLTDTGKKKAGNFSLGMRQRLGIAMALVGEPKLLILDEPLNGLDPEGIVSMRNLILKLNQEKNITFIISSHILSELSLIATRYGIISKGKLIKEISSEEVLSTGKKQTIVETSDNAKAYEIFENYCKENDLKLNYDNNKLIIEGEFELNDLIQPLSENEIRIISITNKETNFEAYYLELIGGKH